MKNFAGGLELVFDPIVDSALIGLAGVVVGVSGYALQNWFIKKRERERDEFLIKRKKYEQCIKIFLEPLYTQNQERELAIKKCTKEFREVCNIILLYGSDEVVTALITFWKDAKNQGDTVNSFKNLVFTMRKDLTETSLDVSDIEILNWRP